MASSHGRSEVSKHCLPSAREPIIAACGDIFSLLQSPPLLQSLFCLLLSWLCSFCFSFFFQHFLLFRLSLLVFSSESVAVRSDAPASCLLFSPLLSLFSLFLSYSSPVSILSVPLRSFGMFVGHVLKLNSVTSPVLRMSSPSALLVSRCSSRMHAGPAAVCHH